MRKYSLMIYRANGNFAERGSGRGGGPGGVRSTRCTLPGGVPGDPCFIDLHISTFDEILFNNKISNRKLFVTRRFHNFMFKVIQTLK